MRRKPIASQSVPALDIPPGLPYSPIVRSSEPTLEGHTVEMAKWTLKSGVLPRVTWYENDTVFVKRSEDCVAGDMLARDLEARLHWQVVPERVPTGLVLPTLHPDEAATILITRWVRHARSDSYESANRVSLARVLVFEALLEKPDNHGDNRVMGNGGRVWSIDHDFSWYPRGSRYNYVFSIDHISAIRYNSRLWERAKPALKKVISEVAKAKLYPDEAERFTLLMNTLRTTYML